jgi:protein required for attachment to host cells
MSDLEDVMKRTKTWVLVADATRARILAPEHAGRAFKTVEGMTFSHEDPKTSEVVRDRLPRTFESVGHTRHAITPQIDPHREEKREFAKELADILSAELGKKSFDRLILVAPPQMLGDLRPHLSDAVRKVVSASLDLDLTKTPDDKIASHLQDVVIA